jgi:hypothetical protein
MRVEKLPFTIYDIVGYFLPGATLLASIVFLLFPDILANFYEDTSKKSVAGWVVIGILATTISYSLGYCIALIASKGIEDPINAAFGYPSEFLVPESDRSKISSHDETSFLSKVFFLPYFLTPLSQNTDTSHPEATWSAARLRGWVRRKCKSIFVKELPGSVIKKLNKRLEHKFSIGTQSVSGEEWFNLVQHYVMNNNPSAFMRMYNYMTIYGFCRNLSAALYCSTFILLVGVTIHLNSLNLSRSVGFGVYVVILLLLPLSGMLAANFAKFYRRYSQEAVYAFVTTDDKDQTSDPEAQNSPKN